VRGDLIAARRPTARLLALAAAIFAGLFAIAFFAAGGGASDARPKPPGEVLVPAPAPAHVVALRSIGSIPPAPAPRKPKKKKKTVKKAPVVTAPPSITPPAVVTPPPPPPPDPRPRPAPGPDPGCVGALC
jgi:hypothetical protein